MSESYEPQGFAMGPFRLNTGSPKTLGTIPEVALECPHGGLQRTKARRARRARAKVKKLQALADSAPPDLVGEALSRHLYPDEWVRRDEIEAARTIKAARHEHYMDFLSAMSQYLDEKVISTSESYAEFLRHYTPGHPIDKARLRLVNTSVLKTKHQETNNVLGAIPRVATINHDIFPVSYTAPPQMGMPDYEPQSGSLETCANLLDSYESVVASPLYGQVISLLRWEKPLLSSAALLATCISLFILRTCVLTVNFLLGMVTGVFLINKPNLYRYSPQAGAPIASTDGKAFTGTQSSKTLHDKPSGVAPPGVTLHPYGAASFGGVYNKPKPVPKLKEPQPNFMGGFAVGI